MFIKKLRSLFLVMFTLSTIAGPLYASTDEEEDDTEVIEVWGESIEDIDYDELDDLIEEQSLEEQELERELEEAHEYSQCLLDVNQDNKDCVSETISQANSDRNTCQAGAALTGGIAAMWNTFVGLGIGVGLAYECNEAADFIIDNAQSYCDKKIDQERNECG